MKKLLITAAMILSAAVTISAQEDSPARTHHRVQKSYNIFFEINSSKVDETYKTNERTLEQFEADCSEDILDRNWQRLILTHLEEKKHRHIDSFLQQCD